MTGDQALQKLLEVSEDVEAAVIFDREGEPVASTVGDEPARFAAGIAAAMLAYADALRTDATARRLEATTAEGVVFVVREGERAVVATTGEEPVAGLVYHDLRALLRKTGSPAKARAAS